MNIAMALDLQLELCKAFGVDPSLVRSITIVADADVSKPVQVRLDLFMPRAVATSIARAITTHAAGIEVVVT